MLSQLVSFDSYALKRITFTLVTKNRADDFEKALKRLVDLKGPNDELIVVDGGSTDATRDVATRFASIIDVFISEQDDAARHAHNKAILLARGKYIKPLGDDDIYHKKATEKAIATLEAHPEIDILICGGTKRNHDGRVVNYCLPRGVSYGNTIESIFKYRVACGVGYIFRRSSFARFGTLLPYEYDYNDRVLLLSALKHGGVVRFLRVNAFHHDPASHKLTQEEYRHVWKIQRNIIREYCSTWFYLKYRMREHPIFGRIIAWKNKLFVPRAKTKAHNDVDENDTIWDGTLS